MDIKKKIATLRSGFFRNKEGKMVIYQFPNLPLIVWAVSTLLLQFDGLSDNNALILTSRLSLSVWSLLEIIKGESPFRRLMGAVVLFIALVSWT